MGLNSRLPPPNPTTHLAHHAPPPPSDPKLKEANAKLSHETAELGDAGAKEKRGVERDYSDQII